MSGTSGISGEQLDGSEPYSCPSCGRPTGLTNYGPEPTLCLACQESFGLVRPAGPNPDNPVWGLVEAAGLWVAAFLALVAAETGAVAYLLYLGRRGLPVPSGQDAFTDPTMMMTRIVGSGVAHLVTFLLAWAIVTDGGRLPFFKSIGWGWHRAFGPATVGGSFVVLYVFALVVSSLLPPVNTPFDRLLELGPQVRLAIGLFAVVSAPFVEEVVYRGVMYPAAARTFGRAGGIAIVSGLFLLVHVQQYEGSVAHLLPLGLLSVVLTMFRAYSGSVLPSYALHLVFNAFQVALMLLFQQQQQ